MTCQCITQILMHYENEYLHTICNELDEKNQKLAVYDDIWLVYILFICILYYIEKC